LNNKVMSYTQNTTPIDLLPDLDDLERGGYGNAMMGMGNGAPYQPAVGNGSSYATSSTYPGATMIPQKEVERIGRFIRGGHMAPMEAGMMPYNQAPSGMNTGMPPGINGHVQGPPSMEQYGEPIEHSGAPSPRYVLPDNSPSCIDCANHLDACPVCAKLYQNNKTIYIVAIVVLCIICLLLLKKVLE